MKIVLVHNAYKNQGGEDYVVEQESKLLERNGHNVVKYIVSNDQISGFFSKVLVTLNLCYCKKSRDALFQFLVREKPNIVHVHNFFPLLTPSIFDACKDLDIPVVMTLHNFRLICPSALLFHSNQIYEKSVHYGPMSTVIDRVYKNSYIGTFAIARMINRHKVLNTWSDKIDKIICLTNFQKLKFQEAGFDTSNFVIKPNFKFSQSHSGTPPRQNKALFVGRLSEEKGIRLLLNVFAELNIELEIAGSGPLEYLMRDLPTNITFLGHIDSEQVSSKMFSSKCLVLPSLWYEAFPLVVVEALSHGLPIICSDIGSMKELVRHNVTGLHFSSGNKASLMLMIEKFFADEALFDIFSQNAIDEFNSSYSDSSNYRELFGIYQDVIRCRQNSSIER